MKNESVPAQRVAGLLGMARRAAKLTTGFDAVAALLGEGAADAGMTAPGLSEKTQKGARLPPRNQPGRILPPPPAQEEIGAALGLKKPVGVLAMADKGLAAAVRRACGAGERPRPETDERAERMIVDYDD